eukprot:360407-Chlamydomonas_euryale.AAC.1
MDDADDGASAGGAAAAALTDELSRRLTIKDAVRRAAFAALRQRRRTDRLRSTTPTARARPNETKRLSRTCLPRLQCNPPTAPPARRPTAVPRPTRRQRRRRPAASNTWARRSRRRPSGCSVRCASGALCGAMHTQREAGGVRCGGACGPGAWPPAERQPAGPSPRRSAARDSGRRAADADADAIAAPPADRPERS